MRIGIIGAGHIGGNLTHLLSRSGHEVVVSFSTDAAKLDQLAAAAGAAAVSPSAAAEHAEAVILSVPWGVVDQALAQAGAGDGSLDGKVVVDTTNQFATIAGRFGVADLGGVTAARFNARKVPAALWSKAFNTLTAGFLAEAAGRGGASRVVGFHAGDDAQANAVTARLIDDAGFSPLLVGGLDDATLFEAPRRAGAVYGEEYREPDASAALDAFRNGRPLPPVPKYDG